MTPLAAISDPNIFRPFLGDLETWRAWGTALRAIYGVPIRAARSRRLITQITGRDPDKLSPDGYSQALLLTGRRSGKSRIAAVCGAYEAALSGRESRLAPGEIGMVAVISPTKAQSAIVASYMRGIFDAPMLRREIVRETRDGFELRSGVVIAILPGDWKTVRGFSLLAAIIDEAAFFGLDAESKVRSDTELIRAILPSLATTGGPLIAISSPYARAGWVYKTYERCWANDNADTLVVNAPSRVMNPTLPQKVVDAALAEDLASAKAEYLAEFRDDVGKFVSRDLIESVVVPNRRELMPSKDRRYHAFADLSGGRSDDAALAIGHREGRTVVLDSLKRYRPPFNPHLVIGQMCQELRRWGIGQVTGDNFAAEFCAAAFVGCGVGYQRCTEPKAQLYLELLPRLSSKEIELLDDADVVTQLAGLERRTRAGGRDIVDHPPGGHDDLANAVAGIAFTVGSPQIECGTF